MTGGAWTKTVLHDFSGGSDGFFPMGYLIDVGGTLYGTTSGGGGCDGGSCGTVFEIRP